MTRDTAVGLPCSPSDVASLIEGALATGAPLEDLVVTAVRMPGTMDLRVFRSDHVERVFFIPRDQVDEYRELVAQERAAAPRSVPIVFRDSDATITISFYDLDLPAGGWTTVNAKGGIA